MAALKVFHFRGFHIQKWNIIIPESGTFFHVRVLGYDVHAPVCLVCLHTLLDHCVYFNCQYEDRQQKRAGRKLNPRKEEDMRSAVREMIVS